MHNRVGELSVFTDLITRTRPGGLFMGTIVNRGIYRHCSNRVMKKIFRDDRGATLVEFALVALPVFLFILCIVQTAWIVWIDNILQISVNAAARCGAIQSTTLPCSGSGVANMIATANQVFSPLSGATFA